MLFLKTCPVHLWPWWDCMYLASCRLAVRGCRRGSALGGSRESRCEGLAPGRQCGVLRLPAPSTGCSPGVKLGPNLAVASSEKPSLQGWPPVDRGIRHVLSWPEIRHTQNTTQSQRIVFGLRTGVNYQLLFSEAPFFLPLHLYWDNVFSDKKRLVFFFHEWFLGRGEELSQYPLEEELLMNDSLLLHTLMM